MSTRERAIVGSLVGTAVGDALGLPYEGLSPRRANRLLGPADRHRFFFGRGMISDDTEHACMVAQSLIGSRDETHFSRDLARRLRNWLRCMPAGIGFGTLRACIKLNLGFRPPRSGVHSAGNGPAMRSAIIGAAVEDLAQVRKLVAASTRITHTDPKAEFGALAIAMAAQATRLNQPSDPFLVIAGLETFASVESNELLDLLNKAALSAQRGESTPDFAMSIGLKNGVSGNINHTVPVVLHACWRYPANYREAVQSVVQCGGDTDTSAAMVGGIVGAAVGKDGIPPEWLSGLRDWPLSITFLEKTACELARSLSCGAPGAAPTWSWWQLLSRNLFFAAIVIAHGLRRLLPPF